jgi:hypothetical protein
MERNPCVHNCVRKCGGLYRTDHACSSVGYRYVEQSGKLIGWPGEDIYGLECLMM